jgi:hypothetical protein
VPGKVPQQPALAEMRRAGESPRIHNMCSHPRTFVLSAFIRVFKPCWAFRRRWSVTLPWLARPSFLTRPWPDGVLRRADAVGDLHIELGRP